MSDSSANQTEKDNININVNTTTVVETKSDKIPVGLGANKGAIPKRLNLNSKANQHQQSYISLIRKEKQTLTAVKNNKINCNICRKLYEKIPKATDKTDIINDAAKHLKEHHRNSPNKEIMYEQVPPSSLGNEKDLAGSWDNFGHLQPSHFEITTLPQEDFNMETSNSLIQSIGSPQLNNPGNTNEIETCEIANIGANTAFKFNAYITKRKRTQTTETTGGIKLSNRFEPLQENSVNNEENTENSKNEEENYQNPKRPKTTPTKTTGGKESNRQNNKNSNSNNNKKFKPPPLIIQGNSEGNNFNILRRELKQILTKGFSLKFTKNNFIIQAEDIEEYKICKEKLKDEKGTIEWHTYTAKNEKTHAFIIKGLDNLPEKEEIQDELENIHKINVINIHIMKTKFRTFYMLITDANTTLNSLKKIKYLNHVEISWELRRQFTDIIQCKNCQRWGHAKSNCFRAPRCQNCGENHLSPDSNNISCNKPKRCANCDGEHQANDLDCNVYKFRVSKLRQQKSNQQTTRREFIDAPTPKENAWNTRRPKLGQKNINQEAADSEEEYIDDDAFPKIGSQSTSRSRQMNGKVSTIQARKSMNNTDKDKNVSDLFDISKQFRDLGNSLNEAIRFLNDFLSIFKESNQENRAYALLRIMTNLNKYDF